MPFSDHVTQLANQRPDPSPTMQILPKKRRHMPFSGRKKPQREVAHRLVQAPHWFPARHALGGLDVVHGGRVGGRVENKALLRETKG